MSCVKQGCGEDLSALARFSFEHADALCAEEHGCRPYHKIWSLLRLFERRGALPAGESFYRQELERVIARGGKRVLLSGAADTGLMALVIKVFAEFGTIPDITLVDRCQTVIEQNKLFVESMKLNAHFFVGDIHVFCAEPFDVIFAHSFIVFFPQAELNLLARAWRNLLKDEGIILTTDYLTTSPEPVRTNSMTDEEIEGKLEFLVKAAQDHGMDTSTVAEVRRCVKLFFTDYYFSSREPLLNMLEMQNYMRMGGLDVVTTSIVAPPPIYSSLQNQNRVHVRTVLGIAGQNVPARTQANP